MRQWFLVLLLMVVGLLATREWKTVGHGLDRAVVGALSPAPSPLVTHDPGAVEMAGQAAATRGDLDEKIRKQEKTVSDLEARLGEKRTEIEKLDLERNAREMNRPGEESAELEQASAAPSLDAQLAQAREALQQLQAQKAQAVERYNRRQIEARLVEEAQQIELEAMAARSREQIAREQQQARMLELRLRQAMAANLNTDELQRLQVEVPERKRRLAALRSRHQELEARAAGMEAISRARSGASLLTTNEDITLLNERIHAQSAKLIALEQRASRERGATQTRQEAGRAQSANLRDRYLERQREVEAIERQLRDAKTELARLRSAVGSKVASPGRP